MFLTRLILNGRNREVRRDLSNCQDMHCTIMGAFPRVEVETAPRADMGILFRIDPPDQAGMVAVLVQSRIQPDWSYLSAGYLATLNDGRLNPACKQIAPLLERLRPGQPLRFRLRANPTKKIETKTGEDGRRRNGRRVKLTTEEDWRKWLIRKAESGGFRILSVRGHSDFMEAQMADHGKARGDRLGKEGKMKELAFGSILFDGRLEVVDPEQFAATIDVGIGSGKAYGFGLLSFAPEG